MQVRRFVLPTWSIALALLVCVPLLRPGYVLSYDMVWVPHLSLSRPDLWGLGTALPRAVPSDAFVALLGAIFPAMLVQKAVLLAVVFGSALGMGRLMKTLPLAAQLAAATLFAWNPFVAERLALGQWPLLLAYAAIPWLILTIRSDAGVRHPGVVLALLATALSPASGLMGVLIALAVKKPGQNVRLAVMAAAVNAPWVVAGLLHSAIARSDSAAVALFDLQPEGQLGKLGAALSLGGIWNTQVVPDSRTLVTATVFAFVIWAVMVVGLIELWQRDRRLLVGLSGAGAVGLVLALSGWLAPGLMADLVRHVPAAGILRDGTRYLLLLAPLEAIAFGHGLHRLGAWIRERQLRQFASVLVILLPIIALPDLAWGVDGRLQPATYPATWTAARQAIVSSDLPGDVLILPFSAYRRLEWNHNTPVLDPGGRFFGQATVTSDVLLVSGKPIAGEDPRAARIGEILDNPRPANQLAREGIGIVVVETDAGKLSPSTLTGMKSLYAGADIEVYAVDQPAVMSINRTDRLIMIIAWAAALFALVLGAVGLMLRRLQR